MSLCSNTQGTSGPTVTNFTSGCAIPSTPLTTQPFKLSCIQSAGIFGTYNTSLETGNTQSCTYLSCNITAADQVFFGPYFQEFSAGSNVTVQSPICWSNATNVNATGSGSGKKNAGGRLERTGKGGLFVLALGFAVVFGAL